MTGTKSGKDRDLGGETKPPAATRRRGFVEEGDARPGRQKDGPNEIENTPESSRRESGRA